MITNMKMLKFLNNRNKSSFVRNEHLSILPTRKHEREAQNRVNVSVTSPALL